MNAIKTSLKLGAALLCGLAICTGCETADHGTAHGNAYNYYVAGYNDPWYHGGYYDDPDVIVVPPEPGKPPDQGLRPAHPIARPPTVSPSRPSIPSAPRPAPRGGRRR